MPTESQPYTGTTRAHNSGQSYRKIHKIHTWANSQMEINSFNTLVGNKANKNKPTKKAGDVQEVQNNGHAGPKNMNGHADPKQISIRHAGPSSYNPVSPEPSLSTTEESGGGTITPSTI